MGRIVLESFHGKYNQLLNILDLYTKSDDKTIVFHYPIVQGKSLS